jgi:hypothetical protein
VIAFIRGIRTTGAYDINSGAGEDGVEQGRVFAVPVAEQVFHRAAGVFEVHDQIAGGLGHPGGGGMGGGAEDLDPAGGVVDDGQGIEACTGQGGGFEEVGSDDRVALGP